MKSESAWRFVKSTLIPIAVLISPAVLASCSNVQTAEKGGISELAAPNSNQNSKNSEVRSPGTEAGLHQGGSHTAVNTSVNSPLPLFSAAQVKTAPVEMKELALPLTLKGKIEPDFNKEVDVTSHLSGRVTKVLIKPGDTVSTDQVLAIVESKEVAELEAELLEAQSKLTMAKAHQRREKVIYEEQVERPKSLIDARTAFKEAGAKRDLAESEYRRTESLYREKIAAAKEFYAAKAELAHEQAAYDQASSNLQREQHMYQNKALLLNDLQVARADTERAESHLDTLTQRLEFLGMSKATVQRTISTGKLSGELSIVAPNYGSVTHLEISEGEVVHPDKPMFTITDLSVVLVRADLPETHLSRVKLGTGVKIKVPSYPDKHFTGKISFIADHVVPETRTVPIRVRLENKQKELKRDMSAEIDLDPELAKVLVCPKKAVIEKRGQAYVFVKTKAGVFEERPVTIGAETDEFVEIYSGVKVGESVALDNLERVRTDAHNQQ
ncbi:MAG TPA: efflux RND transporter periplasmic adaptor subunit [Oculatellaceae cyanobacterium]